MRSLERVNIRTNERTYVLTYIRTGQTLYPLHNFVVRGDKNVRKAEVNLIKFHRERTIEVRKCILHKIFGSSDQSPGHS